MQQLKRIFMLAIATQAITFALDAGLDQQRTSKLHANNEVISTQQRGSDDSRNYASFFLTTGSGSINPGDNVIFNNQVALSGIGYDTETGVFTLSPGTYAVTYFFAPFSIPSVNMYVNDELILNSPLGGSSTVFTVTKPTNTLTLQYITAGSFSSPSVNQSWASIAIFQVGKNS